MEKIIVLTSSNGDKKLVDCLKVLFPECIVETLEKRTDVKKREFFSGIFGTFFNR
jgi:hypothetical protein